jgi:hypothetical protein
MKKADQTDVRMAAWRTNKLAEVERLPVEVAQGYLIRLGWDAYLAARLSRALPKSHAMAKPKHGALPDGTTVDDRAVYRPPGETTAD